MLPEREALSREAKARMSAQETTPGHTSSIAALAASITSRPLSVLLGMAFFSEGFPGVGSMRTEASQP